MEGTMDSFPAMEDEYNQQMEMLEWLKNTCELRLFGEKLPNKS